MNKLKFSLLVTGLIYGSLVGPPSLASDPQVPISYRLLILGLGIFGAIYTHKLGHAVAAKSLGWDVIRLGYMSGQSGIGGGTYVNVPSNENENSSRLALLSAAGSLGQIVTFTLTRVVSLQIENPYIAQPILDLGTVGIFDFPFYAGKDFLFDIFGVQTPLPGDWKRVSNSTGVPLYAIYATSVVWAVALLRVDQIIQSKRIDREPSEYLRQQPKLEIPLFSLALPF